jgi:hypothetical protein
MKKILCAGMVLLVLLSLRPVANSQGRIAATNLPEGYWLNETSQSIVNKTQVIRLAPELSHLTSGESAAVRKLFEVGKIFQGLYELQRHRQASSSFLALQRLDRQLGSPVQTQNLLKLYRLFQGPIATTLDNRRETFLPVDEIQPGKNVYPWGIKQQEIEAFLAAHSDQRDSIMDSRTVVRRATSEELRRDLSKLEQYPVLDTLHPGLRQRLERMLSRPNPRNLYALPYAVAYADELIRSHKLLNEAAEAVAKDDEEFARYLRNRSRDLLSNDYESGDAAWVTGRFKNLNAVIGAYETYDDELFAVKTFFALSVLSVRRDETRELRLQTAGLQILEDSLPYAHHKLVREDIPISACEVIADFGQARGGNTASILPNESYLARHYGRTILLRPTIIWDPEVFRITKIGWEAAVASAHKDELTADGNFYRTVWHEAGHYLGVDRTKEGRDLDEALQDNSSLLEEMKADLVALFIAEAFRKQGYYDTKRLRAVYASGISRILLNNKPRKDQIYYVMQLMTWNFFLQNGLLSFDRQRERLNIHYEKYHEVVGKLLAQVLEIQYQGDKAASDRFIEQYSTWDENLHGVVAKNVRAQQPYRFRLYTYAALGE